MHSSDLSDSDDDNYNPERLLSMGNNEGLGALGSRTVGEETAMEGDSTRRRVVTADTSKFIFHTFHPKTDDPKAYIDEFNEECEVRGFNRSAKKVVLIRWLRKMKGKYSTWYEDEG